jgi:hypothetical protein
MMPAMLPELGSLVLLSIITWILLRGLGARRARNFAVLGLVFAGLSCGAWLSVLAMEPLDWVRRVAGSLTALTAGQTQLVWVSTLALPRNKVWLRVLAAPLSVWAGTSLAFVLMQPEPAAWLLGMTQALCALCVLAWVFLPWIGRDRGSVAIGSRAIPSLRSPCPRCGTRVDWAKGLYACTDCGLFVHLDWGQDPQVRDALKQQQDPGRTMRFACPGCDKVRDWARGEHHCSHCQTPVRLHWNEHKQGPKP